MTKVLSLKISKMISEYYYQFVFLISSLNFLFSSPLLKCRHEKTFSNQHRSALSHQLTHYVNLQYFLMSILKSINEAPPANLVQLSSICLRNPTLHLNLTRYFDRIS